jgi:hypothetical protein
MRTVIQLILVIVLAACGASTGRHTSVELIKAEDKQKAIFQRLIAVAGNALPESVQKDSLAILILPVQYSCPSCRKKTIDSIVKHQNDLLKNHYVIVSATGGRKTMNSYFKEQDLELPDSEKFILDSTNIAYKQNLFEDNPAIYYIANQKAYKKVLALPATVKNDLREFFSGYRNAPEIAKKN